MIDRVIQNEINCFKRDLEAELAKIRQKSINGLNYNAGCESALQYAIDKLRQHGLVE